MGQIKNIKLHIVTDIKILSTNQKPNKQNGCVLATSRSQLPPVLPYCCQVTPKLPQASTSNRGHHEEGVRSQGHQVARWKGHQGNQNHLHVRRCCDRICKNDRRIWNEGWRLDWLIGLS